MLLMPNNWSSRFVTIYPFIHPSLGARLVFLLSRQLGFCRFTLVLTSLWVNTVCSPFFGVFWICQYSTSLGKESSSAFDSFITPNRLLVKGNAKGTRISIQKLLMAGPICLQFEYRASTYNNNNNNNNVNPAHVLVPATNQQQLG
jgi:hypothetical protein